MTIVSGRGLPDWTQGAATIANGSRDVTVTGTALLSTNPLTLVAEYVAGRGDLFVVDGVDAIPIVEVTDATHLKLAKPWTAPTQTNVAYAIIRMSIPAQGSVAKAIQDLMNMGTDANPDLSRTVDNSTARLKLRISAGVPSIAVGAASAADGALLDAVQINKTSGVVDHKYGMSAPGYSGKNLLINGALDLWQRGTSTTVATGTPKYLADRWRISTSVASLSVSQVTSPAGFRSPKAIQLQASAVGVNGNFVLEQRSPSSAVRHAAGKPLAVSFDLEAVPSAGALSGQLVLLTNSGVDANDYSVTAATIAFTPPTSAEKVTVLIPEANTTNLINGCAIQLIITKTGATGNITAKFSSLQFEIGLNATPLECRSYWQTLLDCLHYYENIPLQGVSGIVTSATQVAVAGRFAAIKRAAPTLSLLAASISSNTFLIGSASPAVASLTKGSDNVTAESFRTVLAGFSGLTTGQPALGGPASTMLLAADAEL
jgi:hypothetical protein